MRKVLIGVLLVLAFVVGAGGGLVGREPAPGDHVQAEAALLHGVERRVEELVAGRQAKLEAAAVLFDVAHEAVREIGVGVPVVVPLGDGHPLERVHQVGDGDLLGAAHHAVVT